MRPGSTRCGWSRAEHERSGGICQLGGEVSRELDFDLWRQMSVEHLIGESQGGYRTQIERALTARFPDLDASRVAELAHRIDQANTVTACSFCNSTTSRTRALGTGRVSLVVGDSARDPLSESGARRDFWLR